MGSPVVSRKPVSVLTFIYFIMGPGHDIQSPMVTGLKHPCHSMWTLRRIRKHKEGPVFLLTISPIGRPCHTWYLTEFSYPEEVSVTLQTQRDGPTKIKKTAQVGTQNVCALSRAQASLEVCRCDKGQCRQGISSRGSQRPGRRPGEDSRRKLLGRGRVGQNVPKSYQSPGELPASTHNIL